MMENERDENIPEGDISGSLPMNASANKVPHMAASMKDRGAGSYDLKRGYSLTEPAEPDISYPSLYLFQ